MQFTAADTSADEAAATVHNVKLLRAAHWRISEWIVSQENQWNTRNILLGHEDALYLKLKPQWDTAKQIFQIRYQGLLLASATGVKNILYTALQWNTIAQQLSTIDETDHTDDLTFGTDADLTSGILNNMKEYKGVITSDDGDSGSAKGVPKWVVGMVGIVNSFLNHAYSSMVELDRVEVGMREIDGVLVDLKALTEEIERVTEREPVDS
ncbi:MAG: hypothetical protein MMC33_010343 [Icmadophila ericetorum]|nr:hypothetical protein [Icmadophila ericetorum]